LFIHRVAGVLLEVDAPMYSLSIYDNFTTADGDDIDNSCSQDYTMDWQAKVIGMVTTLNDLIDNGEMCVDESGKFFVDTSTTTFVFQDNQVGIWFVVLVINYFPANTPRFQLVAAMLKQHWNVVATLLQRLCLIVLVRFCSVVMGHPWLYNG
jgi:hypothetical protein